MTKPRLPCIRSDIRYSRLWEKFLLYLGGSRDRHDLKVHQIVPLRYPGAKQTIVVAFHELKAAVKVRFDPASNVTQAIRQHPAPLAQPPVNRAGIAVVEPLDDHEQHDPYASSRLKAMDALVPPNPNELDRTQPSVTSSRRSRRIGMSANAGSRFSILALSQMKPLFIINRE